MRERMDNIDFIKGIAILGVVFLHSAQLIPNINPMIFEISKFGRTGCQFLFVISSFLASISYEKLNRKYSAFLTKKYISLAPLYQITILAYLILNYFIYNIFHLTDIGFHQNTDVGAIVENLLLLNGLFDYGNNNVVPGGWYMGTLIVAFALFPVLFYCTKAIYMKMRKVFFIIPIMAYGISAVLDTILIKVFQDVVVFGYKGFFIGGFYNSFINQMSCFIVGILLYLIYEDKTMEGLNKKYQLWASLMLLVLTVYFFYFGNNLPFCLTNSVFTAALTSATLFIATYNKKCTGWIFGKITEFGKNSYGVYYTHILFVWYILPLLIKAGKYFTHLHFNVDILYFVFLILLLPCILITGKKYQQLANNISFKIEKYLKDKRVFL